MKQLHKGLRGLLAAVLVMFGAHAQALVLTPADADWVVNVVPALNGSDVAGIVGSSEALVLLYKADFGGVDSGAYAGSYSTAYSGDPNNALISYLGGPSIVCPECYLVVKDGTKPQYLFDIGSWNGTEVLDLRDFYVGPGGAISHVAIWGKTVTQVNESGALMLIGLGLLGLGYIRRRRLESAW